MAWLSVSVKFYHVETPLKTGTRLDVLWKCSFWLFWSLLISVSIRQFRVVQLNGLRISIYEKNLETEKKIMPSEQIRKSIYHLNMRRRTCIFRFQWNK